MGFSGIVELELADVTGDGELDIIASGSSVATLVGNGDGTFGTANTVVSASSQGATAADFNSDGISDIASVSYSGPISVHLAETSEVTSTVTFSLTSVVRAQATVTMLDDVLNNLTLEKGKNSAARSRLEVSYTNADAARSNLDAATSRIRDIDAAEELSKYTVLKIRSNTATALFAHVMNSPNELMSILFE